jgi:hypothetical protein
VGVGISVIIEAIKPECTNISAEGPLTSPHGVLDIGGLGCSELFSVLVTVFLSSSKDVILIDPESHVGMGVKDDVFHVIIVEKIIPDSCISLESLVENELGLRVVLTDDVSRLSVVVLESWHVRIPPGLIHGL